MDKGTKQTLLEGGHTEGPVKGCSAPLASREMQIKTTIRYHFTLVRMAIIKKNQQTSVKEDAEKREP